MAEKPRRRATIADAMLLIVGACLSLAFWRSIIRLPVWWGMPASLQLYLFKALGAVAFLIPFSLTLLVIAMRQPRPHRRRVISEPAGVVGLSAFFVLIVNTVVLMAIMLLVGWSVATFTGGKVMYYCRSLAEQTGMAIGAAWFLQSASGRCRPARSWVDIMGFVLGASWIMLAVASVVLTLL